MRRILVSCGLLVVLALPAAAAARLRPAAPAKPGYVLVRNAAGDGGVNGRPVATVVLKGFVLGRVSQEARVDVFRLQARGSRAVAQVRGTDLSTRPIGLPGFPGTGKEYTGSNLRFRVLGGYFRLVVRGAGIYLFAGGAGAVWLRGSSVYEKRDGKYWLNDGRGRSMPTTRLKLKLGGG
jgi:hypothetical protein